MKKLTLYFLLAAGLVLAACGGDDPTPSDDSSLMGNTQAPHWALSERGQVSNPQWSAPLDSLDLSSSMTMTIYLNSAPVSVQDSVAAFIDDTLCIGVAELTYIPQYYGYFFNLFVNRPLNHTSTQITLRYYCAERHKVYSFTENVPSYVNDGIYGTYDDPLTFTPSTEGYVLGTTYAVVRLPDNLLSNYSTDDEIAVFDSGKNCIGTLSDGIMFAGGTDATAMLATVNLFDAEETIQVKYYSSKLKRIYVSDSMTVKITEQYKMFEPAFKAQE